MFYTNGDVKLYDTQSSFKKVTAKNSIRICFFLLLNHVHRPSSAMRHSTAQ